MLKTSIPLQPASGDPSASNRRRGLAYHLGRLGWVHRLVAVLGVYRLVNFVLKNRPIGKQRPLGGHYRLKSVASFPLEEEMFASPGCYDQALADHPVETFVDLGCNSGWFPILLKEANPTSELKGILIDADPAMVEEARWHLQENGLTQNTALWGVVGCPREQTEVIFYVNPSNTQSSIRPLVPGHPFPLKGKLQEVKVPCLQVEKEWKTRFGDRKIDLLKIDIEGSELDLIKSEIAFIRSGVSRIICEWHEWHVRFDEIRSYLRENGFELFLIIEQDENGGVAIFNNASVLA